MVDASSDVRKPGTEDLTFQSSINVFYTKLRKGLDRDILILES